MFDMDGTLLKRRTIFVFADKLGFTKELLQLLESDLQPYEITIEIAKLLKGVQREKLLALFREIPLQDYVEQVIRELKHRQVKTAIVTNSYQVVADDLQQRLDVDYVFANNLIIDDSIVTGEVDLHNRELREECDQGKIYSINKGEILEYLCQNIGITSDVVIAVGDGMVDCCMLQKAGLGIAFKAPLIVQQHADISTDDMQVILDYL
jgi:phosphoserine phosphatase